MASKRSSDRGCVGLLAMTALTFGAAGFAWSFYLSQTQAGEQVSLATGLSFYLGLICATGGGVLTVIFTIINIILRTIGSTVDRFGDKDGKAELSDLIPGGGLGKIASIGAISRFFGKGN